MAAVSKEEEEEEDCWNVFESDDDDDYNDDNNNNNRSDSESNNNKLLYEEGVLWLTTHFVKWNPHITLSQRRAYCCCPNTATTSSFTKLLKSRGLQVLDTPMTTTTEDEPIDAAIILPPVPSDDNNRDDDDSFNEQQQQQQWTRRNVVPNGVLVVVVDMAADTDQQNQSVVNNNNSTNDMFLDDRVWIKMKTIVATTASSSSPGNENEPRLVRHLDVYVKQSCPINYDACPWATMARSSSSQRRHEQDLLSQATVTRSAYELPLRTTTKHPQKRQRRRLTTHDVERATKCLQMYGYCIIRNLICVDDPLLDQCLEWGQAILDDLHEANLLVSEKYDMRLLKNTNGSSNSDDGGTDDVTSSFCELAMREEYRMDVRDGPHIRRMRQKEYRQYQQQQHFGNGNGNDGGIKDDTYGNGAPVPIVTTASGNSSNMDDDSYCCSSSLRFHPDVLEIVRRTMNPTHAVLCRGNFGRYNFDGSGPDGSFPPLRIGPMGGIVTLPGAADQAIHADTPHLFEHIDCLPAHYVNAFCLGMDVGHHVTRDDDGSIIGSTPIGGTAFVHGSHRLSFTARMELTDNGRDEMLTNLVRPSLQMGDVVLFDCRVLHFGMANASNVERPMLYTNMTHAWFHDPKNWDDRKRIWDELC